MNLAKALFRLLLGRRLPITEGTLRVPDLQGPITVRRDRYGIPTIDASNDEDAWYGLGFCQGQDRSFQIETLQRVGRGTMAALIGPSGLAADRLSRRIGYWRAAQAQLAVLPEHALRALEAYSRGVNAGRSHGSRRPAHAFRLLRAQPTPHTPADSLAYVKVMSFFMSSNWSNELARWQILRQDGPDALAAVDPAYPDWHPVTAPVGQTAGPALDRLAQDLAHLHALVDLGGGGSNNWAVAGRNTASGRPILANDPHLGASLPPHWYLAHLRTPEWAVAGAAFVGGPAFPAAHNGTAAWGVTAALIDNTDLFIEEIGPDGRSVREGDAYVACPHVVERIEVRGGETVEEVVLLTPRGPIIGPALGDEHGAISIRANWLDPRPICGLLDIHRVRSFAQLQRLVHPWPGMPQNVAYADTSGTIGWQLMGDAPVRRKGWGTLPLPGWDPEAGWEDEPLPYERMPGASDPACGYLATANTRPTPEGVGPFLGVDFIDGYRLARILQALGARHDWDVSATLALQLDQVCLPWREMREAVLAVPPASRASEQARELLQNWDGVLRADSPAATLYELWLSEISKRILRAKAPRSLLWALGRTTTPVIRRTMLYVQRAAYVVRLLREQPPGWFGEEPDGEHAWAREIAEALGAAYTALEERFGTDPARWAWGRVRPLVLRHPLGRRKPLDRVYNLGPLPWGGDTWTVSAASSDLVDPLSGVLAHASLRLVVDVGAWDESRFVLPGGQSGNPLSPHYDDQFALWQRGKGVPIAWSDAAVEAATCQVLQLYPMPPSPPAPAARWNSGR